MAFAKLFNHLASTQPIFYLLYSTYLSVKMYKHIQIIRIFLTKWLIHESLHSRPGFSHSCCILCKQMHLRRIGFDFDFYNIHHDIAINVFSIFFYLNSNIKKYNTTVCFPLWNSCPEIFQNVHCSDDFLSSLLWLTDCRLNAEAEFVWRCGHKEG